MPRPRKHPTAIARVRAYEARRVAAGARRINVTLEAPEAEALDRLIERNGWGSVTDAIRELIRFADFSS